jgi:DNA polymerase-1
VQELKNIGKTLDEQISQLEEEIRQLGGKDKTFNINSPKQLGTLLFEELGIPVRKKTKTGYSTDIEVLESLKNMHPIIDKIIQIRKASKLNSTYVKGLLSLVDSSTSKIHTTFNQTITTTGRISSSEPNLQNIPIRTPEGRLLRKAFTAQDRQHVLIDADYSQIELRVLADISGDESLIRSFINNEDIHQRTAAEVFNVPLEMVTKSMRSRAKAVNFGIIYGISDYGLAKNLMISRKEARQYIDIYLQRYEEVQNYMDEIILFARKNGYVETKFNRRRYIPKINDRNYNERSFAERTALNTPIQGTAADIIKIAMNRVYDKLGEQKLKSKLILQVHDELIVHAPVEEVDIASQILKEEMQSAAQLKVPLKVDICAGFSWYDCK